MFTGSPQSEVRNLALPDEFMRILVISHAPLTSEFGASQLAINLSEALRAQGHDVTLWSPRPLPEGIRWWRTIPAMRAAVKEFLQSQNPFDVVDSPPTLVMRSASGSALIVARSTQPDLLYLWSGVRGRGVRNLKQLLRLPFEWLHTVYHALRVIRGWSEANRILCLGSLELKWMRRWFPWWRHKTDAYLISLSKTDQEAVAEVRKLRRPPSNESLRFLWIGRWTAHKGTDLLLVFIQRWAKRRPQDAFTIAGCGADAEADIPAELLRSGLVNIEPSFDRETLYQLLAKHDVGLFTSYVEGWGLSVQEMLESGMPVYATRAGAVEDLTPYFDSLLPFPPPNEIVIPPITEPSRAYYHSVAWSHVAQTYTDSVPEAVSDLATSRI